MRSRKIMVLGGILLLLCLLTGTAYMLTLSPEAELRLFEDLYATVGDLPPFGALLGGVAQAAGVSRLEVDYDPGLGSGYIIQKRHDGKGLLVNFSLHGHEEGAVNKGPVIGGRPEGFPEETNGIAWFDGGKWRHLWCNANEGIAESGSGEVLEPHKWKYLDGGIEKSPFKTEITARYQVTLGGQPLTIERKVVLGAESDYLEATTVVANKGQKTVFFDYAYGDEPWIGEYGSSKGDIGWAGNHVVTTETYLDPLVNYAGFWDIGNNSAGESGDFTGYANYLEWSPGATMAYFSNDFHSVKEGEPLASAENRILNVVWMYRPLPPGKEAVFIIKIGKARQDTLTSLPGRPAS